MSNVETALLDRIPIAATAGRKQAIRNVAAASLHTKGHIEATRLDRTRTTLGHATDLHRPYLTKTALPALLRAKIDHAYGAKKIEQERANLRRMAAGEPKATDTEWREIVRKMDPNKAAEFLLNTPAARGPALREPELAFISKQVHEHIMERQSRDFHERPLALLNAAIEAQEVHSLVIAELEKAILSVPAVVEQNGSVRSFNGPSELAHFTKAILPGQIPADATKVIPSRAATPVEEAFFDIVDDEAA